MTEPVLEHAHCFNCRGERQVTTRYVGDAVLYKCTQCGLWIRCPDCMHIRAVEHSCPTELIEVPS
jgi:hypothetical protein